MNHDQIKNSIISCIGNTPLVEIPNELTGCKAKILVKLEEYNWGGSIKSRVGYQMIRDAERMGRINTQECTTTIIEATGGNTGIGIAQVCAFRGYRCLLVVPDNYSEVRVRLLEAIGAKVLRSDHNLGNDSHVKLVKEILVSHPDYLHLDQFNNQSNVNAHYFGTGKELVKQVGDCIDAFVSGVGSGGTITGCGKAIKERYPQCLIAAVQPKGCDVIKGESIPHQVQGTALGFVPSIFDKSIVDMQIDVTDEDINDMRLRLPLRTGLYLGISSLANIIAAIKLSRNNSSIKTIVTISPDGGRNY